MNFNFDMVKKLVEILDRDQLDQGLYEEFLTLDEVKDFIKHDQELGRDTNEETLKLQLEKAIKGVDDLLECNGFNIVKANVELLKKELKRIDQDEAAIKQSVVDKIDRFLDTTKLKEITVYFYGGGIDYGYSTDQGKSYLNIGSLVTKLEYLVDIMAHECYHARENNMEELDYDFSQENYLKTLMYHIIEEGIATLVQFGCPKAYDEFTFVTKQDFDNTLVYLGNLDKCIKEIELEKKYSQEVIMNYFGTSVPNYVVGYHIAEVLFQHGGKELLNLWHVEENDVACFQKYIEILRDKGEVTGFSKEVEDFILGM